MGLEGAGGRGLRMGWRELGEGKISDGKGGAGGGGARRWGRGGNRGGKTV